MQSPLQSPRMESPTRKKSCSLLFNNTIYEWYQNLSHIRTYLSTSKFVCEHGFMGSGSSSAVYSLDNLEYISFSLSLSLPFSNKQGLVYIISSLS